MVKIHVTSEVFFKIKFIRFWVLPSCNFFFIMKINIFRGELSDISAKTATLHVTRALLCDQQVGVLCHARFRITEANKKYSYKGRIILLRGLAAIRLNK